MNPEPIRKITDFELESVSVSGGVNGVVKSASLYIHGEYAGEVEGLQIAPPDRGYEFLKTAATGTTAYKAAELMELTNTVHPKDLYGLRQAVNDLPLEKLAYYAFLLKLYKSAPETQAGIQITNFRAGILKAAQEKNALHALWGLVKPDSENPFPYNGSRTANFPKFAGAEYARAAIYQQAAVLESEGKTEIANALRYTADKALMVAAFSDLHAGHYVDQKVIDQIAATHTIPEASEEGD